MLEISNKYKYNKITLKIIIPRTMQGPINIGETTQTIKRPHATLKILSKKSWTTLRRWTSKISISLENLQNININH